MLSYVVTLYFAVLYHIAVHRIVSCCIVLYRAALHCIALLCTVFSCLWSDKKCVEVCQDRNRGTRQKVQEGKGRDREVSVGMG